MVSRAGGLLGRAGGLYSLGEGFYFKCQSIWVIDNLSWCLND